MTARVKQGDRLKATIECPACGGDCAMSITKNMTVFTWCITPKPSQEEDNCGYRGFLGRPYSREIIKNYNEKIGEIENVQVENGKEEPVGEETIAGNAEKSKPADTGSGDEQPEQPATGLAAGLKHFFTGDE